MKTRRQFSREYRCGRPLDELALRLHRRNALRHTNLARLLAYSSISHTGYALMGLSDASVLGVRSVTICLLIYVVMNLGAFLAVIAIAQATGLSMRQLRRL
jgi:NADH-quinone oxidoreductase subunit N